MAAARAILQTAVTIASGGTESGAAASSGLRLIGVGIPAAFTGANVSVQLSYDGGDTYYAWTDAGAAISMPVAVSSVLDCWPYPQCTHAKVVSDGAEGAARTVQLIFGEV